MSDKCLSYREEISNLLDEKSEPSQELTNHLTECEECRDYNEQMSFLHVLAVGQPMEEPPIELKAGVMTRLRLREESAYRFSRFVIFEFALVLAACAIMVVYGGVSIPQFGGYEITMPGASSFYPEQLLAQPPTSISLSSFYPTELMKTLSVQLEGMKVSLEQQMTMVNLSWEIVALLLTMTILTLTANVLVARSNGISVPERT